MDESALVRLYSLRSRGAKIIDIAKEFDHDEATIRRWLQSEEYQKLAETGDKALMSRMDEAEMGFYDLVLEMINTAGTFDEKLEVLKILAKVFGSSV